MMRNMVILGAGTSGALLSNLLSRHLDLDRWWVTVIDRSMHHVYKPGLVFLPFGMYGYDSEADVSRDILAPLPDNVRFVAGDIKHIDHQNRVVETDKGDIAYDFLVSALGCQPDPCTVKGLAEAMGTGDVHTFCTVEGAMRLQGALESFQGGRLVIDICDVPIKYPVTPFEFAFLADYHFHRKGMRERVEISLVLPDSDVFNTNHANRELTRIAELKGIKLVPKFTAAAVDPDAKKLSSRDGRDIEFDLLVAIPGHVGAKVLDDSGLGDGKGYALTDPRTFKSKHADFVYCMGDNTNVAVSKAAVAHYLEAGTVLENLLREMEGQTAEATFQGHASSFIDAGFNKALRIDFKHDTAPPGDSMPRPGTMTLSRESLPGHLGKLALKWVYWNMLLPGRLTGMPFLWRLT